MLEPREITQPWPSHSKKRAQTRERSLLHGLELGLHVHHVRVSIDVLVAVAELRLQLQAVLLNLLLKSLDFLGGLRTKHLLLGRLLVVLPSSSASRALLLLQ